MRGNLASLQFISLPLSRVILQPGLSSFYFQRALLRQIRIERLEWSVREHLEYEGQRRRGWTARCESIEWFSDSLSQRDRIDIEGLRLNTCYGSVILLTIKANMCVSTLPVIAFVDVEVVIDHCTPWREELDNLIIRILLNIVDRRDCLSNKKIKTTHILDELWQRDVLLVEYTREYERIIILLNEVEAIVN